MKPCASGDKHLQAAIIDKGLILFQYGQAMGYIDVEFCPICGKPLQGRGESEKGILWAYKRWRARAIARIKRRIWR